MQRRSAVGDTRQRNGAARTLDTVDLRENSRRVDAARSIRKTLAGAGARRWSLGSVVGLAWLVNVGADLYGRYPDGTTRILLTVLLVVLALAFMAIPPLNWSLPPRLWFLLPTALWLMTFLFVPFLGWGVYTLWAYVGVCAAMSMTAIRPLVVFILALVLVSAYFARQDGVMGDNLFAFPTIIGAVSLMMAAFARQVQSKNQLVATQHEMARLAVEQERGRVARDMHDILGHSLTVITVKAELAGRLLETDPQRAAVEIAELEDLARGALADVRSTVAGYRGMNVVSELAGARAALESAGIRAELPGSADVVPAAQRELFGWALREGITNVVRHSGASCCVVELGPSFITVEDDGRGPIAAASNGTGLEGLRERSEAAGARMTIGRAALGGFSLRVGL